MGQHKHNPVAIAAKKGGLKPKEKGLSKAQSKKLMWNVTANYVKSLFPADLPNYNKF